MATQTAFALAGLGGNNAHGAGFLAAAQEVARGRGEPSGILPGLDMISCTSGAIATTASYLRGGDLRAELEDRIAAIRRATMLPDGAWADSLRLPVVTLGTGVPGVFGPYWQAITEHLWRYAADQVTRSWQTIPAPPTFDDFLDLWYPARTLVPELPAEFFEHTAATFNNSHIGVACNSFDPGAGIEYLYINDVGMTLIKDHHDPDAAYGQARDDRVVYQAITPAALRDALWLFYYGFDGQAQVDGAYARSIILDELTFAKRIWAVKPINDRWLGRLPGNLLEVLDMQTELWMGSSYREQARTIALVNRLGKSGRRALREATGKNKTYHSIDLKPVEIGVQRGFFSYFVEDITVFQDAYGQAIAQLAATR
jgi:hypothetical protein